jgi:hypothetical protein
VGGAARQSAFQRVIRIDTRFVPSLYVIAMGAWVHGFAALDRELPPLLTFLVLLVAAGLQVAVGYAIGRWGALGLALVPIALATGVSGVGAPLFVALVVLMAFPGTPLIGLGVWARRWRDETSDDSPDAWLYGERPS